MTETLKRTLCTLNFEEPSKRDGLKDWRIGEAFAFNDAAEQPIVFLGRPGGAVLDSNGSTVTVSPAPIDLPRLEAVFTDRDLYREGQDIVRIVACCPREAEQTVTIVLDMNGQELARPEVELDGTGMGLFELPEPVAGEYEVHFGASTSTFTVAAYKLAPLTARFEGYELQETDGQQTLAFSAQLETYGSAFFGEIVARLKDLGQQPPAVVRRKTMHAVDGRIEGRFDLSGSGPFAIDVQARDDPAKTATLPVPGTREEERDALELSSWGARRIARLVPFEGSRSCRGLSIGEDGSAQGKAPIRLVEVNEERATLELRADVDACSIVALNPVTGEVKEQRVGSAEAGETLFVCLSSPWTMLLAGVLSFGGAWEGRAAVIGAVESELMVEAPERAEPGQEVTMDIKGPAGASVFVMVKDARLQAVDTPLSSAAAGLRRQIVGGLSMCADGPIGQTLEDLLPLYPIASAVGGLGGRAPWDGPGGGAFGAADFEADDLMIFNAPRMELPAAGPIRRRRSFGLASLGAPGASPPQGCAAPAQPSLQCESMSEVMSTRSGCVMKGDLSPAAQAKVGAHASTQTATRSEFLEVVLARIVELDDDGWAQVRFTLGDSMGLMSVEAFSLSGYDWVAVQQNLQVTKELFGELVLPPFVKRGDYAEGMLYVSVAEGEAEVVVRRNGEALSLFLEEERGDAVKIAAPGGTVRFVAAPGEYEAEVVCGVNVDVTKGKVEEPGKLVWLQRAIRLLSPGERVTADDEGVLSLKVLPSLDDVFDRMVGGLQSYRHCCCEQTSAVMLAAAAAYLTAKDDETRHKAANHIRACVAREKRMYLPGRGFKGWPSYPNEVFPYSPGATLNLLQMEMLKGFPMDSELEKAIGECLEMARDAAKAHGIETAPERPKSAREAYGRFSKFVADRQRMATFIRDRVEPWGKEMQAILDFEMPSIDSETYHRSPAMIRAETAYGAAALIEAGGEHLEQGLALANTVLDAVGEEGSLYSTLDSVAAITLLSALKRSRMGTLNGSSCLVDDERISVSEATRRNGETRSIEATDGPLQVEVARIVEEDYTALDSGVAARISLERRGRRVNGPIAAGDAIDLVLDVEDDYEAGDLVHLFLPDALSWVHGGGQVKRFSLDLEGKTNLRIPLAATGLTLSESGDVAPQHFAVCLRNMYDEERGKGFGDIAVIVAREADGPGGLAQKVWRGLKAML